LDNEEWKYDIRPEIINGKNIADYVDQDILEKLDQLEKEED
jgi:nucleolar GTP-binding protein